MPIDQQGFRADVIVDPQSIPHRMNGGQLYAMDITRTAEFVRRRMQAFIQESNVQSAWNICLEFLNDINPVYAQIVSETNPTPADKAALAIEWANDKIYINIPPGLNKQWEEFIPWLMDKWGSQYSPATFTERNHRTGFTTTVTTEKPISIGSKYILLLYKMPEPTAPGIAYTSQHGIPVKPSSRATYSCPISMTPLRYGADEFLIQIKALSARYPYESPRFLNLMSNSPTGVAVLIKTILNSSNPIVMQRVPITTRDLVRSSTIISQIHHLFSTVGVDSENTAVTPISEVS